MDIASFAGVDGFPDENRTLRTSSGVFLNPGFKNSLLFGRRFLSRFLQRCFTDCAGGFRSFLLPRNKEKPSGYDNDAVGNNADESQNQITHIPLVGKLGRPTGPARGSCLYITTPRDLVKPAILRKGFF